MIKNRVCSFIGVLFFALFFLAVPSTNVSAGESGYTDLPQLYITTSPDSVINTDTYSATSILLKDPSNHYETLTDENATIKIRGNSTATLDKKPYNFKLSAEKSILGMPEGKKWCLLANRLDKSLMRNKLAYDFALKLNLKYCVQSRYVDVWLNNQYQGNYLLTQPVDTGTNLVDINTKENEFLLERESNRTEEGITYVESPQLKLRFELNAPKTPTEDQLSYLTTFLRNVDQAVLSGDYETMEQYIDIPSFLDFYILSEIFKNIDIDTSSTRFYIKNEKLYAGPVWDLDISSGNISPVYYDKTVADTKGMWATTKGWIGKMITNPKIYQQFCRRYKEVYPSIQNLYEDSSSEKSQINQLLEDYRGSFERDSAEAGWNFEQMYYDRNPEPTFQGNADFLKIWLKERCEWLYNELGCSTLPDEDPDTIMYNVMVFARFQGEPEFIGNEMLGTHTRREIIDNTYNASAYSMQSYYRAVSNEKVNLKTVYLFADDHFSSFVLDHTRGYYSPKTDQNPEGYEGDAWSSGRFNLWMQDWGNKIQTAITNGRKLSLWDEHGVSIPLEKLDANGDGKIDSISLIYSKESVTGDYAANQNDVLWAYQGDNFHIDIPLDNGKTLHGARFSQGTIQFDEKSLYTDAPENGKLFLTPSTIIHETGHVFGLQDLYYYYDQAGVYKPVYYMSPMAKSMSPVTQFLTCFERETLGWLNKVNVKEIKQSGTYKLAPLKDTKQTEPITCKIKIPDKDNLWLYMEYRYCNDNEINRFQADKAHTKIYRADGSNASGSMIRPSKSGLLVYVVDTSQRFPSNAYKNSGRWGIDVLGGTMSTRSDAPRAAGEFVEYGNMKIQVNSCSESEVSFEITGLDAPEHIHQPAQAVHEFETAATCESEGGYDLVIYCIECNEELSREHVTIPKKEHIYDEGVILQQPTTTAPGIKEYTCTLCGNKKQEEIPMLPAPETEKETDKETESESESETETESPTETQTESETQTETQTESDKETESQSSIDTVPTPPVSNIEQAITSFSDLKLKTKAKKNSIRLSWSKRPEAEKYILYGAPVGKAPQKIAEIPANKTSYVHKKAAKSKYYQYYLVSLEQTASSPTIHKSMPVYACPSNGKHGNPVRIKGIPKKLKLKLHTSRKLHGNIVSNKRSKNLTKKLRYESSNPKVASVSKNGKIKARSKGSCIIYVYTQNGICKKVKVRI